MASEPIVGPPVPIGATGVAVADPLVRVPPETPCVVTLFTAGSPTGTFDDFNQHLFHYAPPPGCKGPWNKVVFKADFNVTAGNQFDRTASIWIGGVNLYFGTTQEPSASVSPSWHVERDVTDLTALLLASHTGNAELGNVYNSTYNGSITGGAELDFYPATPQYPAANTPNEVLSLGSDPAGSTSTIDTDGAPLTRTFTLPTNIDRAYLDVVAQPQSGDEFWYTCFPEPYAAELDNCGGTGFREAEVAIDGKPAGIVPISGWVFTGGVDPFLWRPVPGVQTLNFEPYRVDITPFAGLLDNGQPHTVSIAVVTGDPAFENSSQYFSTAATLLFYEDHAAAQLTGALTQDVDSGVHPIQNNVANPDGIHFAFTVTSHHSLVTRGYLDTPQGRVSSNVVQDVRFSNAQRVVNSDNQFRQDITQTSTALERSFGNPPGGASSTTVDWSFPLTMDIDVEVAANGSETQATSVAQHYSRTLDRSGPGGHYADNRQQGDTAADTLDFDANGNFTGNSGPRSRQSYQFTDSRGACYSRTVASVAGAVTAGTGDATCKPGQRQ